MSSVHIYPRESKKGKKRYYIRSKARKDSDSPEVRKSHGGYGTLREALAKKREVEQSLADGSYWEAPKKEMSFSDFSAQWLRDYASLKKGSTEDDYTGVVNKHLNPYFGKKLLSQITPADVQNFVTTEINDGYSPRNINKGITVLKLMLKHAEMWGLLKTNPARFVERPREPKKEMEYLTPDEVRRLLDADASPRDTTLFAAAIFTGLRQGEVLALRWNDIDLERCVVYVRRSYHDRHGFDDPKSSYSRRTVDIPPRLRLVLQQYKDFTGGQPDDLLFEGKKEGRPPSRQNLLRRHLYRTLDNAEMRRVTFHALRHTYAALMLAAGANLKYLQHQMGHSSIRVTLDNYGHLLTEVGEGVGTRMESLVWDEKVVPFPQQSKQNEPE